MYRQHYYIDKTSDTSADTLLAVGFALLLERVLHKSRKPSKRLLIRDQGSCYEITLPVPLSDDDVEQLRPFSLFPPLVTDKFVEEYEKLGQLLDGFLYQRQQEIRNEYFGKLKSLPPVCRTPEARLNKSQYPALLEIPEPADELGHYQTINQMKIAPSFNELAQRWIVLGPFQRELIRHLMVCFQQPGNDLEGLLAAWRVLAKEHQLKGKALVTQLQIINPASGKGANRPKSSTLSEGNPENFWLLELLKFAGFLAAAAPYVIQGSKDRKTYVLQPAVIELSTLQGMMRQFRAVCWSSSAIKLDILASLRFTQVFMKVRKEALQGTDHEEDDLFVAEQLSSIAQGFEVTFYKDMGSAYATMNVATINLPYWIRDISTLERAERAHTLLLEHLTIIQQLRNKKQEEGAEEYILLHFYRDFLSRRDLRQFWQFTTAYSSYLISQREGEKDTRRWIRPFTTEGLETLIRMSDEQKYLSKITSTAGFQRIAYAIRQATVRAQYRRSQQRDRTYEVRYGLGQELIREARYKEKFLISLSHFLHDYNAETAREEEKLANRLARPLTLEDRRTHKLRGSVANTDIDDIIALADEFGSEIVCHLLVAYGYASDPRKESPQKADDGVAVPSTGFDEEINRTSEEQTVFN